MQRVCFVSPSAYGYFAPEVGKFGGGAQRQLYLLSQELQKTFDVHFIVGDYGQSKREQRDGVTVHRSYRPSPDTSDYRKPAQLVALLRAMARADADVYVYRGRPFQAALIYSLTRLLGRKWVYNLANDPNIDDQPAELPGPVRWLFERALADADAIITQTDAQADKLHAVHGIDSTVVPSGYPPAESVCPHDQRESFLWVGRLDPDQKRPHLYVDIARKVPEAEFLLVGPEGEDESYNATLRDRIDETANLTYVGLVDPDAIHEYYRDAVALVNTSAYEGFPNTFLEAWRYETPVVSLEVPVTRYTNIDAYEGDAGGEFDNLAALTSRLASDPSFRTTLAKPTAEYFRDHLTIEQVADRYGDALQHVLDA